MSPHTKSKRVLISGIGLCTPLGATRELTWARLCAGQSGLDWLAPTEMNETESGMAELPPGMRAGGAVDLSCIEGTPGSATSTILATDTETTGTDEAESGSPERMKLSKLTQNAGLDRVTQLAHIAADEAWEDAGLSGHDLNPSRIACVVGTSKGGMRSFAQLHQSDLDPSANDGLLWEQFMPSTAASSIARMLGIRGATHCPVAACATGLASLFQAQQLLQSGDYDIVVVGSVDASLQPALLGSFSRLGVLARHFHVPAEACRPFDTDRDGFLVGEGAAIMVLETFESARRRGLPGYAEWSGGLIGADTSGLLELDLSGNSMAGLAVRALEISGVPASAIDMVNLHGTATLQNDICESVALKQVLGSRAARVRCVAHKSSFGHMLGAAGSVETAVMALSIGHQVLPPTLNCDHPDPECGLNLNSETDTAADIAHGLKLSLGFGGHLGAAVLSRLN